MQKLADLFSKPAYEGAVKVDLKDIFGKEIEIREFKTLPGQYGNYVSVLFFNSETQTLGYFNTGSKVVREQLEFAKTQNALPGLATLVEKDDYFVIQ